MVTEFSLRISQHHEPDDREQKRTNDYLRAIGHRICLERQENRGERQNAARGSLARVERRVAEQRPDDRGGKCEEQAVRFGDRKQEQHQPEHQRNGRHPAVDADDPPPTHSHGQL